MLEDFVANDDKPTPPEEGNVAQPNTQQAPASTPVPTPPSGPYRPSILNQNVSTTPTQPKEDKIDNSLATPPNEPTNESKKQEQPSSEPNNPPQEMTKKNKSKIKKILLILGIIVLLGGGGAAAWWFGFRDTGVNSVTKREEVRLDASASNTPKLVPAALSGLDVEESIASRPVTAIMIENSEEARPQSGLADADVVFEAIAEGGITRFVALFQSKKPEYIGPIRSARPYYVEWAKTFDASYVHAGGSPDGLQAIGSLGVKDISAFAYGDDVFYRTSDRQAPHNLYSSFKGLDKVNQEKGFTTSKFTPWGRKKDVPQTPQAKTMDITISSPYYNPSYAYDATTNSYLRSQGGEIHKDEKSGKQLAPKTVLVMAMSRSQNGVYSVYKTNGSGKFLAFQDGVVTEGTWSRTGTTDQYTFKDANGFDFLFNKGQTWVSIVTDLTNVKYIP